MSAVPGHNDEEATEQCEILCKNKKPHWRIRSSVINVEMTSSVKMTNSIVFALALCLVGTRAEVYSSATDMKSIFELERDLAEIISGYAFKLEQKVQRINRYLMVSGWRDNMNMKSLVN